MIANPKSTRWLGTFMGSILVLAILAIGYTAAQTQEAQTQAKTADASTGEWPEEFPPNYVLAPRFLDPKFEEEPPEEKKPHSLVVPFARESWAEVRKKAISKSTSYSRPFAKGETLKPSEVSIPSRIPFKLTAGTERRLRFDKRIPELTFSRQEVLELTPLAPRELLFVGKKPGISNVRLTYEDGSVESIEVTVNHDATDVKKAFAKQFPNEQVFIIAKNAELALVGSVHDKAKAAEMIKFVETFTKAEVNTDNFGSLVAWKIQVYEFSMKKFRNLGITNPTDKKIALNKLSQLFFQKKGIGSPEVHFGVRPDKQHEATIETFLHHDVAKLMDQPWLISNSDGMTQFFIGAQSTGGVITMPPIPADPEWDPARPLDSFELKAHQMTPEGLTLEMNIRYSAIRDVSVDGKIARRLGQRKIQTGFQLKFGETVMVIQEPSDEESRDKATMTLITPKLPK